MLEVVKFLFETAGQLLPVRIVFQWQAGLLYVGGRYWKTVGPGLKLVVPGLMDVKLVSTVPEIYATPLQTITLRDGRPLTYSASITLVVTNPALAYNAIGHYAETIVELAARMLSEGLADADPERFDPARGKRDRLLEEQRKAINEACLQYGLEITALGLNNFVLNIRTLRLLTDRAVLG